MNDCKLLPWVLIFSCFASACGGRKDDPSPSAVMPATVSVPSLKIVHANTFSSITTAPQVQWTGYDVPAGQKFEYCIRSQPTVSCDVLNWTSAGAQKSLAAVSNLSLFSGDTYYYSVRVINSSSGNVIATATSNGWVSYAPGRIFYINSATGNDSYDGLSATPGSSNSGPWKTLERIKSPASNTSAKPGGNDTIMVATGVYAPLKLYSGGSPGAPMTLRAMPGSTPEIKANPPLGSWFGIQSDSATDLVIDGFKVTGPITDPNNLLAAATADASLPTPSPLYNGNGIVFGSLAANNPATFPKGIVIRRNTVSGWGGGGLAFHQADYINIFDNIVFNNNWYNKYATSGISLYGARDSDANTSTYKNRIQRNIVYNNYNQVPWRQTNQLSDGNGIIIDDFDHTQAFNYNDITNGYTPYLGKTLISDNLVVGNGGSGIHTYLSKNVDIIRNTSYMNSLKVDYGEIFSNASANILIAENIMIGRPGRKLSRDSAPTNVSRVNNLFYGSGAISSPPGGTIASSMADIGFVNPGLDVPNSDFTLLTSSLGANRGSSSIDGISRFDIRMRSRGLGGASDLGAYESQ